MNLRNLLVCALLGITTVFSGLNAEERVDSEKDAGVKKPAPPTHRPPPPPSLKPPPPPPGLPPSRDARPARDASSPKASKESEELARMQQMPLKALLKLPNEQLTKLKGSVESLSRLNPDEKQLLKAHLEKIEQSERKREREKYLERRREFNRQARILLWELMNKEEKAAAQNVIKAAKTKKAKHLATMEYIKRALKDPEFEKEVNSRTDAVLKKETKAPQTK